MDGTNILQVRNSTTASRPTDPCPDNTRRWCKKARKSGERGTSPVVCPERIGLNDCNHKSKDLPHPIPCLEHDMSVDCPRNIKVDLDIVCGGYVDAFLLPNSTHQYFPSLIHLTLTRYCLPRDPGSLVAAFTPDAAAVAAATAACFPA